ncbi:J domain-containing protein [Novipirellula artificiosorum]|uniref:Lipocalin-like domain-containing protein n=1 Tax=Novipirellula artificiosorum TaxID=2528016 RepID=A0A5C6DZU3_9BACT|nr:hypothetical protein [Novipirellula artificiosorum]TWU40576.1 hypothetical protein Poly41_14090 [Novipirellula artificiosorum]
MRAVIASLAFCLVAGPVAAQSAKQAVNEKLEPFEWMIGHWTPDKLEVFGHDFEARAFSAVVVEPSENGRELVTTYSYSYTYGSPHSSHIKEHTVHVTERLRWEDGNVVLSVEHDQFQTKRKLETKLMRREDGVWIGYIYPSTLRIGRSKSEDFRRSLYSPENRLKLSIAVQNADFTPPPLQQELRALSWLIGTWVITGPRSAADGPYWHYQLESPLIVTAAEDGKSIVLRYTFWKHYTTMFGWHGEVEEQLSWDDLEKKFKLFTVIEKGVGGTLPSRVETVEYLAPDEFRIAEKNEKGMKRIGFAEEAVKVKDQNGPWTPPMLAVELGVNFEKKSDDVPEK